MLQVLVKGRSWTLFGFGALEGSLCELCSALQDRLILNNYWPASDHPNYLPHTTGRREASGSPLHRALLEQFPGRADFCIPIIVHHNNAFNIQERATPEMPGPGLDQSGKALLCSASDQGRPEGKLPRESKAKTEHTGETEVKLSPPHSSAHHISPPHFSPSPDFDRLSIRSSVWLSRSPEVSASHIQSPGLRGLKSPRLGSNSNGLLPLVVSWAPGLGLLVVHPN